MSGGTSNRKNFTRINSSTKWSKKNNMPVMIGRSGLLTRVINRRVQQNPLAKNYHLKYTGRGSAEGQRLGAGYLALVTFSHANMDDFEYLAEIINSDTNDIVWSSEITNSQLKNVQFEINHASKIAQSDYAEGNAFEGRSLEDFLSLNRKTGKKSIPIPPDHTTHAGGNYNHYSYTTSCSFVDENDTSTMLEFVSELKLSTLLGAATIPHGQLNFDVLYTNSLATASLSSLLSSGNTNTGANFKNLLIGKKFYLAPQFVQVGNTSGKAVPGDCDELYPFNFQIGDAIDLSGSVQIPPSGTINAGFPSPKTIFDECADYFDISTTIKKGAAFTGKKANQTGTIYTNNFDFGNPAFLTYFKHASGISIQPIVYWQEVKQDKAADGWNPPPFASAGIAVWQNSVQVGTLKSVINTNNGGNPLLTFDISMATQNTLLSPYHDISLSLTAADTGTVATEHTIYQFLAGQACEIKAVSAWPQWDGNYLNNINELDFIYSPTENNQTLVSKMDNGMRTHILENAITNEDVWPHCSAYSIDGNNYDDYKWPNATIKSPPYSYLGLFRLQQDMSDNVFKSDFNIIFAGGASHSTAPSKQSFATEVSYSAIQNYEMNTTGIFDVSAVPQPTVDGTSTGACSPKINAISKKKYVPQRFPQNGTGRGYGSWTTYQKNQNQRAYISDIYAATDASLNKFAYDMAYRMFGNMDRLNSRFACGENGNWWKNVRAADGKTIPVIGVGGIGRAVDIGFDESMIPYLLYHMNEIFQSWTTPATPPEIVGLYHAGKYTWQCDKPAKTWTLTIPEWQGTTKLKGTTVTQCIPITTLNSSEIYDPGYDSGMFSSSGNAKGDLIGISHGRGRLGDTQGWSALSNDQNQWWQIDAPVGTVVTGVAVKGRGDVPDQYVKKWKFQYYDDFLGWQWVDGSGAEFAGTQSGASHNTQIDIIFSAPITTTKIRFRPWAWNSYISARMGLLIALSQCLYDPSYDSEMLSSNSIHNNDVIGTGHGRGRLGDTYGWSAASSQQPPTQWWQINVPGSKVIGAAVKGRGDIDYQYVKKWKFQYWDATAAAWQWVDNGAEFDGTQSDASHNTQIDIIFSHPITTTKIRFRPWAWYSYPSARMGLLIEGVSVKGTLHKPLKPGETTVVIYGASTYPVKCPPFEKGHPMYIDNQNPMQVIPSSAVGSDDLICL